MSGPTWSCFALKETTVLLTSRMWKDTKCVIKFTPCIPTVEEPTHLWTYTNPQSSTARLHLLRFTNMLAGLAPEQGKRCTFTIANGSWTNASALPNYACNNPPAFSPLRLWGTYSPYRVPQNQSYTGWAVTRLTSTCVHFHNRVGSLQT
jgi:hypothetical protein